MWWLVLRSRAASRRKRYCFFSFFFPGVIGSLAARAHAWGEGRAGRGAALKPGIKLIPSAIRFSLKPAKNVFSL